MNKKLIIKLDLIKRRKNSTIEELLVIRCLIEEKYLYLNERVCHRKLEKEGERKLG